MTFSILIFIDNHTIKYDYKKCSKNDFPLPVS